MYNQNCILSGKNICLLVISERSRVERPTIFVHLVFKLIRKRKKKRGGKEKSGGILEWQNWHRWTDGWNMDWEKNTHREK